MGWLGVEARLEHAFGDFRQAGAGFAFAQIEQFRQGPAQAIGAGAAEHAFGGGV